MSGLSQDSAKHSVMIVDDDKDILSVTSKILERSGFKVHGFSDPIAALQHVENGCMECGVLVSDVRMPKMTGFQLVRRTKELRPNMKIIMMTAFEVSKSEFESVFPSTPIDNIVRKPFLPPELVEAITETYKQTRNAA